MKRNVDLHRRTFLRAGLATAGALALGPSFWQRAYAAPAQPGPGPYGELLPPDANGLQLPAGFTSRVLAEGERPVEGTTFVWHRFPDGGATYPADDGGWIYASNSEVPFVGGVSAMRFGPDGAVQDAYRILTGTSMNCAGGPTPWGTWLSCEEHPFGRVWECDPTQPGQGVVRPALGMFAHEAVAVDPVGKALYLTEDDGFADGDGFYRFTPAAYPDLSTGVLEVASMAEDGAVTWLEIDPLVPASRQRQEAATVFEGAEGVWYDAGHVYFSNKGDNRVWDLDVAAQRITLLYDAAEHGDAAPLTGVDNIVVSPYGDILVAEDGGNMEIVLITVEREVTPLLRIVGHDGSEITGPAFDPSGTRLYFSSQRGVNGTGAGITYEVSGPFRVPDAPPPAPGTGAEAGAPTGGGPAPGGTPAPSPGGSLPATGGLGLAAPVGAGLLAAAAAAWRVSRPATPDPAPDPGSPAADDAGPDTA